MHTSSEIVVSEVGAWRVTSPKNSFQSLSKKKLRYWLIWKPIQILRFTAKEIGALHVLFPKTSES